MPENRSRFVLMCQQLLAFGTVLAVAAPAASVVTLDIVAPDPVPASGGVPTDRVGAAVVASAPTRPDVREIPVAGIARSALQGATAAAVARRNGNAGDGERLAALSEPQDVSGYATVGVTWEHGVQVDEDEITVSVRSLEDGEWGEWQPIEYHDDHGPDPDSEEARNARPGTDPIVVGAVDEVQVKIETPDGEVPADTELAVIDPGATAGATVEKPAIDTAELPSAQGDASLASATTGATGATDPEADDLGVLTATAEVTPKPKIFSRAQWGADERMRDKSSLSYYEVHAGFVHHTVNANDYTRDQVPQLLRGIYAYHTQSKGWSDIGYNFVVDRFGRIWEGRYGGVDRPVVGAHTLNYNEYSFAMSALGNFDVAKPSSAMLDAYGRLFAWKLSLHGVKAGSTSQVVGSSTFKAINGHRDAGQTACPGRYLYAKVPDIRTLAVQYQKPFSSRARSADLAGSPWPDMVVRDQETKRAFVVRTGGQVGFQKAGPADKGFGAMDLLTAVRDVTGDGIPDMVGRNGSTKSTAVYPGTAQGDFGAAVSSTMRFAGADQMTGAMDMTDDGKNDLVVRSGTSKKLYVYPGNGQGGFRKPRLLSASWGAYSMTIGAADMNKDGHDDLVVKAADRLYLVPGTGTGLGSRVRLPGRFGAYDLIGGLGDVTNDGKADLVARARQSKLGYIFPGTGTGSVGQKFGPFTTFRNATYLGVDGQLAGNSRNDVVTRNSRGGLLVHPNNGAKNVEGIVDTGTSLAGTNLVLNVGDWNGDGHGDVMTRVAATGVMQLRLGDGRGKLAPPVAAGSGWKSIGLVAAVGDFTGDGFPDLMGQPSGAAMRIYPGNGSTGFRSSYVAHSSIASTGQTGLGLWDGDGSPDSLMRRSDGTLQLYPGNGPGGLLNPTRIGSGASRYDWLQSVGDANGDGRPDLVGRERTTGVLWLVPGARNGFGTPRFLKDGFARFDLSS